MSGEVASHSGAGVQTLTSQVQSGAVVGWCFLCEEEGAMYKIHRGASMDRKCYNAVRAHHRALSIFDRAIFDQLMYSSPDVWRQLFSR